MLQGLEIGGRGGMGTLTTLDSVSEQAAPAVVDKRVTTKRTVYMPPEA